MADGYYRHPTIHGDTVVFACEDDLWTVPASGGVAQRLTSGHAPATTPRLSPDGRWIAFIGRDEGHPEVYVMPADGGAPVRRTFQGATVAWLAGWGPDGRSILFTSNGAQPMVRMMKLFAVDREGGAAREQPYGVARAAAFGRKGTVVGRHGTDPARWKRYRGGTVGQLWIDRGNRGRFERLIETGGNLSHPMWIGDRVYFHSDHEKIGNLYSCAPDGKGLRRHTDHVEYYLRNPSTDGRRIVYHAGADLYLFDPAEERTRRIGVDFRSPRSQRVRRFSDPAKYLEDYAPHPQGYSVALTARGKAFTMANWEGAVIQHGRPRGARYRLARWLPDGKRIVAVTDEEGEESLAVYSAGGLAAPRHLGDLSVGRVIDMAASPAKDQVVLANHRCELIWVDLATRRTRILDRSAFDRIAGLSWSPDGRWVAYGFPQSQHQSVIKLCEAATGKTRGVTRAVLRDRAPAFDPEGKYLYFLSYREFNPVYDNLHFELGFPRGVRPYLVTLRKDLKSPFTPEPKSPGDEKKKPKGKRSSKPERVRIDLDGIEDRVVPFPVPEGRYEQILGIHGAALFSSYPVEGALAPPGGSGDAARGLLEKYAFEEQKRETVARGVADFALSADAKTLFYRDGSWLRAVKAGEKPDEGQEDSPPSRKSGWIDLGRIRLSIDPAAEWRQMFEESWRLMRDHFWAADLCGVDWKKIRNRYRPLLDRVSCRAEFSDLIWEMQGETGTSHCYEYGGDYRAEPRYDVGLLGADLEYDSSKDAYRVARIVRGDAWDERARSPLAAPGLNVRAGDLIVAVNGRTVGRRLSPQELLVHQAGQEVNLTLDGGRTVTVRTLRNEYAARYREWVERNRDWVHKRSKDRAGYIHVPDMGPQGFAEFHRQYLAEVDRDALLIDVRYNGGGHVSQLLLEKLLRKRIGYDVQRWGPPVPYPGDSPAGPIVALTNEEAGSDGDIFSHCFKLFKLGPLVGRRTWGGVVGIWPRHALADGSVTTQPEFSFWFKDVGFGVENHGTEPDVDIDIAPHEHAAGKDPQLEKGLAILMDLARKSPSGFPLFKPCPVLTIPDRLPPRPRR